MQRDELNAALRRFVKDKLTPTQEDRDFVSTVYDSIRQLLNDACIQIGSYPRFTAIRPVHDLDILYLLGPWDWKLHDPAGALKALYDRIISTYKNPTKFKFKVTLQTHSVTITFTDNGEEILSVDIVPAYADGKNEFGQEMYRVPEVLRKKHGKQRAEFYISFSQAHREMLWIPSDPRGYIEVASRVNQSNPDFRRTVKFVKAWKNACKENHEDFPLKSFHLEQVVTGYFQAHEGMEIFDGIFMFFVNLPETIRLPQIKDRADGNKFIDDYLADLTSDQKKMIIQARDYILKVFEERKDDDPIEDLLDGGSYERAGADEQFLFDFNIPTLTDERYAFAIRAKAQVRDGGFKERFLDAIGRIDVDRKIEFRTKGNLPKVDLFKWKVKNDDCSPQPRGEISDHRTRNDPEHTKYIGDHYVECYAILHGTCVWKDRQNVKLGG